MRPADGDLAGGPLPRLPHDPRPRLLHLGNVVVDVIMYVPSLPEAGGDVLASRTQMAAGGGFNVMAAAARQGLAVAYGGAHGTGPFGDLARAALAAERITVLTPPREEIDTGFVMTAVDQAGERTFFTSPGAEATLTGADLATVVPGARDVIYLSGYGLAHRSNAPTLVRWLARLPESQVVVFDPGPLAGSLPPAAVAAVLARTTWLTCNSREAAALTGTADPAAAARQLSGRPRDRCLPDHSLPDHSLPDHSLPDHSPVDHSPVDDSPRNDGPPAGFADSVPHAGAPSRTGALVRTGAKGCVLAFGGGEPVKVPGFPVTPVDTNGAGDAHTGVFVAALAAGMSPAQAARRANAAAALSVTRMGPATCPASAEIDRLLAAADDQPS